MQRTVSHILSTKTFFKKQQFSGLEIQKRGRQNSSIQNQIQRQFSPNSMSSHSYFSLHSQDCKFLTFFLQNHDINLLKSHVFHARQFTLVDSDFDSSGTLYVVLLFFGILKSIGCGCSRFFRSSFCNYYNRL